MYKDKPLVITYRDKIGAKRGFVLREYPRNGLLGPKQLGMEKGVSSHHHPPVMYANHLPLAIATDCKRSSEPNACYEKTGLCWFIASRF